MQLDCEKVLYAQKARDFFQTIEEQVYLTKNVTIISFYAAKYQKK